MSSKSYGLLHFACTGKLALTVGFVIRCKPNNLVDELSFLIHATSTVL